MDSAILFFAILLVPCLKTAVDCKRARIVQGEFALPGQFPYAVSLQFLSNYACTETYCGGSILDARHIVTAAHCITNNVTHQFESREVSIIAGTADLNDKVIGVYRDVEYMYVPRTWIDDVYNSHPFWNDIAILKERSSYPGPGITWRRRSTLRS
uniref:Peptidase S1 domain-containing protein n=1 Tax=Trichogramma kaykai TaxID=54128 RepID=A0ABD2WW83_9HYME